MSEHVPLRKPYLLLGVVVVLGWTFFFFRSEFFELKDVEIQSSGGIVSSSDVLPIVFEALDARPARPWSKRQTLFLPKQGLEEGIKAALYAEEVKIEEINDNVLRLKISFGSRFLYTTHDGEDFLKCAVARPAGIALDDPATLAAAKKRYLLATDFTTLKLDGLVYVRKATTTLEVPTIKRLLDLGKTLDEYQIKFAHLEEGSGQEVSVQLDRDRQVLMDLAQPMKDQVERCQAILREKEYQDLKPLTIDLRIPGRAYLR